MMRDPSDRTTSDRRWPRRGDVPSSPRTKQRLLHWQPYALLSAVIAALSIAHFARRSQTFATPVRDANARTERADSAIPTELPPADTQLDLPSTRVAGVVITVRGAAIRGARICGWSVRTPTAPELTCTASDDTGGFVLDLLHPQALFVSAPRYVSLRWPLGTANGPTAKLGEQRIVLRAGGAALQGSVSDASGGPVVGALVTVRSEQGAEEPSALAVSGSAGEFSVDVPPGRVELWAQAQGYGRATAYVSAPDDAVNLKLAPASSIAGRVEQEETGEGLGLIEVTITNENGVMAPPVTTRTQPDGTFSFTDLPAGGYNVSAIGDRLASPAIWVNLGVGEAVDALRVPVSARAALRALLRINGRPCRDGRIELSGRAGGAESVADTDGKVLVRALAPGAYEAQVRCTGAVPRRESIRVDVASDQVRVFDLESGLALRGRVETASGEPLEGALVLVQPSEGEPSREGAATTTAPSRAAGSSAAGVSVQCSSDGSGKFECGGLQPGTYECLVYGQLEPRSERMRVTLSERESPFVVLRVNATGSIRVTATRTMPAASGLRAYARSSPHAPPHEAKQQRGEFVFEHLPLGPYTVSFGLTPEAPSRQVELRREGEVIDVVLPAPESLKITGRIVDERGEPIPDTWVKATSAVAGLSVDSDSVALSNELGSFRVDPIAAGHYTLSTSSRMGEARLDNVVAGSDVILRVERFGAIRGSVRDASGKMIESFTVEYRRTDGETVTMSGQAGRWSLPWLRPGTYELHISNETSSANHSIVLPPAGAVDVETILVR